MSQRRVVVTDVFGIGRAFSAIFRNPISLAVAGGVVFALMYGRCW